jgi:predicted nucleotide-binding protein
MRGGLVIPFTSNDDQAALRPQIRSAWARVNEEINKTKASLGTSPGPDVKVLRADARRVFVVHGRNTDARDAMFAFLRAINLDPIEWEEAIQMTGEGSPFIGHVLDVAFSNAQSAVILVTGDDVARLGKRYQSSHDEHYETHLTPQARPNVLFEAGMAFGRYPERTVIVALSTTRLFSDIHGRHILFFSDDARSRKKLADRLKTAQCAVRTDYRDDWLTAGDFTAAHGAPDSIPDDKTSGLRVTRRRASQEEGATFRPKVWVEIRNDSDDCLDLRHRGWVQTSFGIRIKTSLPSVQLKIGKHWCPEKEGVERLHVPPDETIQARVQPTEQHDMADLEKRCQIEGQIGTIVFLVNGNEVRIDV